MKNILLFIFSLILLSFGLYFSPSDFSNKYVFNIIAYVVPLLLLYYLLTVYILRRYRARKVFLSKRNLDKFLDKDQHH